MKPSFIFSVIWVDANDDIVFHPRQRSCKSSPRINRSELPYLLPLINGTITHKSGKVWIAPLSIKKID